MTSIAHETRSTAATPVEQAVFVTDDDRRSRIARRLALIVLAVAGLWLAALAVGMLGLGQLPGVSLPLPGVGDKTGEQIEQPSPRPLLEQASVDAVTPASAKRQAAVRAAATTAAAQRSRAKPGLPRGERRQFRLAGIEARRPQRHRLRLSPRPRIASPVGSSAVA
jgi:hypothetical protein